MGSDTDLAALVARYATADGMTETSWPGLYLVRLSEPMTSQPMVYEPLFCVVAQGTKYCHLEDRTIVYDALNYLMCSLTLPIESELRQATADAPYLGVVLKFDPMVVGKLLMEMDEFVTWPDSRTWPAIAACPMTDNMTRAMTRLVHTCEDPLAQRVLGSGLVREILYEALRGPQGYILRDRVLRDSSAYRVARTIAFLEQNFRQPLDVEAIAKHTGMSTSALHHHFKQATTMSPMQFVKKMRLHQARQLLLSGSAASEAAFAVGYNTPSQFSREFRRLFGMPPNQVRAS